jgi:hypothetical protein
VRHHAGSKFKKEDFQSADPAAAYQSPAPVSRPPVLVQTVEGDAQEMDQNMVNHGVSVERQAVRPVLSQDLRMCADSLHGTAQDLEGLEPSFQGDNVDKRQEKIADLRRCLRYAQMIMSSTQVSLDVLQVSGTASSRAGYLNALEDLIGNEPEDRTWQDEWVAICCEFNILNGTAAKSPEWADPEYVKVHDSIEENTKHFRSSIDDLVARGWDFESAQAFKLLNIVFLSPAAALRERSSRFAAATHKVCNVLFAEHSKKNSGSKDGTAPSLYLHRRGKDGLCDHDPAWGNLEVPDRTGFCGLTCSALIEATCEPQNFTEEGFAIRLISKSMGIYFEPREGDIVRIDSLPDDERGCHSATMISEEKVRLMLSPAYLENASDFFFRCSVPLLCFVCPSKSSRRNKKITEYPGEVEMFRPHCMRHRS